MTEAEQRRQESPLLSDRGVTTIKDTVVSRIAGMAAGEVDGVRMGGSASRSAGGLLENITGSDNSTTRGVGVEVGSVEAAIDLKMGIDYGKNILGTVGEVRQKITERVQNMTGLKVTELNVTISEIVFPENGEKTSSQTRSRSGPDFDTRTSRGEIGAGETRERETRETERPSQIREREATPVEPESRTHTGGESGPVPDEEVRAEGTPVDEDETRRLRFESDRVEEVSSTTTGDEDVEAGSPEASGAERPTDDTTLTGGPSSGERAARETASSEGDTGGSDDRTQEIDRQRVAEAEERMARRRRERRKDG